MALYVDYAFYTFLYGEIPEQDFNRLAWDACKKLDNFTTGADGYKKLKWAFPVDEDDAEAVKQCAAKLIYILQQIEEAEKSVTAGRGYEKTENGIRGKVITNISSGSESISYSAGNSASYSNATIIDKALADKTAQNKLFSDTVREYLSGVTDANGVKLLFMGVYPCV